MKRFGLLATLTITLLTLAACGNSVEGLDAAEQRWVEAGIDSYSLEYTIGAGEGAAGSIRVEVVDGEVIDFDGGSLFDESMGRTVEDLFEEARTVANDGVVLAAEFDPEWGYPTLLSFDPIENAIDDEYFVRVTDLTVGPQRNRPIEHRVLLDGAAVGPTWEVAVATSSDELDALTASVFADIDFDLNLETIDANFAEEVVFAFHLARSGSCPLAPMEGLAFDEIEHRLYPVVSMAEPIPESCTADANPHTIMIAVRRDDLPTDSFDVWVRPEAPQTTDDFLTIAAGELSKSE